jgi:tRNA-uridine 2-sulfurtransferase
VVTAVNPNQIGPKRIVVAMSGGVDSSVVAALLKRQGHDVVGITLQLYDTGKATGRKGACCAGQDIQDARRVAEKLAIPHYVLDYEARFADAVIGSFAESYIAGETPIPCVTCNQQIKFRDLMDTAKDLGADTLATGHYIQKREGVSGPELRRAKDCDRDQSYFLFATTREQLGKLTFPLGGYHKSEVRALARELELPVADKADSQDICFVPKGRYTDVIERLKPGALKAGDIVHADGRILGRHDGIINYTVGQRKGLGLSGGEALYVLRLDAGRNRVVVGPRGFLRTDGLLLRNVNWLGDEPIEAATGGTGIYARIRSTSQPQAATLQTGADGKIRIMLHDGEYGVAAGQACVFYDSASPEARVLGGGWIEKTLQPAAVSEVGGDTNNIPAVKRPLTGETPVHVVRGASG